jgi:hypothetical protein
MRASSTFWLKRGFLVALIFMCGFSVASDAPANVAGTWTVSASDGRRNATQTLVIQQDGAKLTGTFKGPRQSGTIEGSVTGTAISFHVKARTQLDYIDTVDGSTMKGTLSGGGRGGNWTATRTN